MPRFSRLLNTAVLVLGLMPLGAQAHDSYYTSHSDYDQRMIYVSRDHGDEHSRGRDHGRKHHRDEYTDEHQDRSEWNRPSNQGGSLRFGSDDLNVIINWYNHQPDARAYMQHDNLPPGIERQIRVRGHYPPGLRITTLPHGLARSLGPAPRGYDRVLIGDDVALINLATGVVVDMIRLVR